MFRQHSQRNMETILTSSHTHSFVTFFGNGNGITLRCLWRRTNITFPGSSHEGIKLFFAYCSLVFRAVTDTSKLYLCLSMHVSKSVCLSTAKMLLWRCWWPYKSISIKFIYQVFQLLHDNPFKNWLETESKRTENIPHLSVPAGVVCHSKLSSLCLYSC